MVTLFMKFFGALKKAPNRVKFVDHFYAFAKCNTTNTEVVQAF